MIEAILSALAALVGALAPSVQSALTGGKTTEEWINEAREAAKKLPVRTGDGGAWSADTERRIRELGE